jgi:hypothetical protein
MKIFTVGIVRAYQKMARVELCETGKSRMNIDDSRGAANTLHNFRIRGLWTACTRLMRKNLNTQEFD